MENIWKRFKLLVSFIYRVDSLSKWEKKSYVKSSFADVNLFFAIFCYFSKVCILLLFLFKIGTLFY